MGTTDGIVLTRRILRSSEARCVRFIYHNVLSCTVWSALSPDAIQSSNTTTRSVVLFIVSLEDGEAVTRSRRAPVRVAAHFANLMDRDGRCCG